MTVSPEAEAWADAGLHSLLTGPEGAALNAGPPWTQEAVWSYIRAAYGRGYTDALTKRPEPQARQHAAALVLDLPT